MANSEVFSGEPITAAKVNEVTVGTTAPASPVTGNIWVDTNSAPPISKVWDGAAWQPVGSLSVTMAFFMAGAF